jgi:Tol biopolymer transport system component
MTGKARSGGRPIRATTAAVAALLLCPVAAAGATTELASVGTAGSAGGDLPAISAHGRFVAFRSASTTLVPGDTNDAWDVFVRDRITGTNDRVSVSGSGAQADADSAGPLLAISGDGRYVAFESLATNLVGNDTNGLNDIFVRDRQSGRTLRADVSSTGRQANGTSELGGISRDGRFVVFSSSASTLIAGDTNNVTDVFVRNLEARTTVRIATGAFDSAISANGVHVAFRADDRMFVVNRQTHSRARVDVSSTGQPSNGFDVRPRLSADGRYVVFESDASNLVPGDTNGITDIFVRDVQNGSTQRVSVSSSGTQIPALTFASYPSISADGRYVTFFSSASNLVPGDTNGVEDVFLRDRQRNITGRISLTASGGQANGDSLRPAVSLDGAHVAFDSTASNLVSTDTDRGRDVFVRDRTAAAPSVG